MRHLLCKRRLSKGFFVFMLCVALVVANIVMVRNTPLNKITSALCIEQPQSYLQRSSSGEQQDNLMASLSDLVNANQSASEKVIAAMKKLLQSETDKTMFLEWASSHLTNQNSEQVQNMDPQLIKRGTNVTGSLLNTKYHSESAIIRKGLNEVAPTKKQPSVDEPLTKVTCPEQPPDLIGAMASHQEQVSMETLNSLYHEQKAVDGYPLVEKGGHYKPQDCKAVQKLAIIIPYRNRYPHLLVLLYTLIPFLRRQQSDFQIFIIEQNLPTTFNRGMLQNVGYLEALKIGQFDCFVFHDVDMLPLNDRCLYRCKDNPMHLTSGISKWKYGLPYNGYFGGVTAFSREQYKNINGNSNLYFGWGGEDDDLKARIAAKGYKMFRYPKEIGRYDMIKHTRDAGNNANPDRLRLLKTTKARQQLEGLGTTKYNVTNIEYKPLLTWIYVSIDMNDVLKTAPAMTKSAISTLLLQAKKVSQTER